MLQAGMGACKQVYGWVNKSIHHHNHHSTARRAKCAAHAKCAEKGRAASTGKYHDSAALGLFQKGHIEECEA